MGRRLNPTGHWGFWYVGGMHHDKPHPFLFLFMRMDWNLLGGKSERDDRERKLTYRDSASLLSLSLCPVVGIRACHLVEKRYLPWVGK